MPIYNSCCSPTYLVTTVSSTGTAVVLSFRTVPTLADGSVIKFRIADSISNSVTAGLPVNVIATVNGSAVSVPLHDSIGNLVRSGDGLKSRVVYTAVFGSDPNHLQIVKANGRLCLKL